jgi:acetyl-CoA carboxylase carboxyl transferase subunit beta
MDLKAKFQKALNVCSECGYHFRFTAEEYIELLCDVTAYRAALLYLPRGRAHVANIDKLIEFARATALLDGASLTSFLHRATLAEQYLGVMNFAFMGGSMGSVVGEKIARWAARSIDKRAPLVIRLHFGGARMQEGVFSLMQMAKTLRPHRAARPAAIPSSPSSPIRRPVASPGLLRHAGDADLASRAR